MARMCERRDIIIVRIKFKKKEKREKKNMGGYKGGKLMARLTIEDLNWAEACTS